MLLTATEINNAFDFSVIETEEIDFHAFLSDPFNFDAQTDGDALSDDNLGL